MVAQQLLIAGVALALIGGFLFGYTHRRIAGVGMLIGFVLAGIGIFGSF